MREITGADITSVDRNHLDEEWLRQPGLVRENGEKLADLRERWEQAKLDKEVLEDEEKECFASLALRARRRPDEFGLDKVTEAAVEQAVLTHPEYKAALDLKYNAQKRVIKARHAYDVQESVVKGLDQKRPTLEWTTRLYLNDYWAEPRVPEDLRTEVDRAVFGRPKRRSQ